MSETKAARIERHQMMWKVVLLAEKLVTHTTQEDYVGEAWEDYLDLRDALEEMGRIVKKMPSGPLLEG